MDYGIPVTIETPAGNVVFNQYELATYLRLTGFELNRPVRANVENAPQRDGAILARGYRGALYPILPGVLVAKDTPEARRALEDDTEAKLDTLLAAEGVLRFTPHGQAERRSVVQLLEDVIWQRSQGMEPREFQIALVSADPRTYAQTEQSADTTALTTGGGGSFGFPFSFPFTFGEYSGGGTVTVTNGGNQSTPPRVRIYGQITAPAIRNLTNGKVVSLAGLSLGAGDFAEIDMRLETVRLNAAPEVTLLGSLDTAVSEFWELEKGPNSIRLSAASFDTNAKATIFWRDAWAPT